MELQRMILPKVQKERKEVENTTGKKPIFPPTWNSISIYAGSKKNPH